MIVIFLGTANGLAQELCQNQFSDLGNEFVEIKPMQCEIGSVRNRDNQCGPVSLYLALKFASPSYRLSLKKSGMDKLIPYTDFLYLYYLSKTSEYAKSRSLSFARQSEQGSFSYDVPFILKDILQSSASNARLESMDLVRLEGESPLEHIERVHQMLKRSIKKGMPVPFTADWYRNGERDMGHVVVIVAVENEPDLRRGEFKFRYYDGNTSKDIQYESRIAIALDDGKYFPSLVDYDYPTRVKEINESFQKAYEPFKSLNYLWIKEPAHDLSDRGAGLRVWIDRNSPSFFSAGSIIGDFH